MPLERRLTAERFRPYINEQDCDTPASESAALSLSQCSASLSRSHGSSAGMGGATKEFDPVTFSFLKVTADEYAKQLTLIDIPLFRAIQPEELSSCAWNRKDKLTHSPNVVGFTRRFNQVCLWCQREILSHDRVRHRAEVLGHFVKICRKLLELNNLHSAFAILSALKSSPIYRLRRTRGMLSGRENSSYEKASRFFSEENNWERLRGHLTSTRAPCIPYLGLYLSDLVYIDVAHPASGTLDKTQRDLQMNNILRVLSDFQDGLTALQGTLVRIEWVQGYFANVRYIDELQKFVEEENYKRSLHLEPAEDCGGSMARDLGRRDSGIGTGKQLESALASRSALSGSGDHRGVNSHGGEKGLSLTPQVPPQKLHLKDGDGGGPPFKPGHRKTQSLGNSMFDHQNLEISGLSIAADMGKLDVANKTIGGFEGGREDRYLLDDSLVDPLGSSSAFYPPPTHSADVASYHMMIGAAGTAAGGGVERLNSTPGAAAGAPQGKPPTGAASWSALVAAGGASSPVFSLGPDAQGGVVVGGSGCDFGGDDLGFSSSERFRFAEHDEGVFMLSGGPGPREETGTWGPARSKGKKGHHHGYHGGDGAGGGSVGGGGFVRGSRGTQSHKNISAKSSNRGAKYSLVEDQPEHILSPDVLTDLPDELSLDTASLRQSSLGPSVTGMSASAVGAATAGPATSSARSAGSLVVLGHDGTPLPTTHEGPVRRKTLMRHGVRPTFSHWTRYWLALVGATLYYYPLRVMPQAAASATLTGTRGRPPARALFRKKPSKMVSIAGWMALLTDDPIHNDGLLLQDVGAGHVYKFRTGSHASATAWVDHLKEAVKFHDPKIPDTLITL